VTRRGGQGEALVVSAVLLVAIACDVGLSSLCTAAVPG
jgi:hypothetical protein